MNKIPGPEHIEGLIGFAGRGLKLFLCRVDNLDRLKTANHTPGDGEMVLVIKEKMLAVYDKRVNIYHLQQLSKAVFAALYKVYPQKIREEHVRYVIKTNRNDFPSTDGNTYVEAAADSTLYRVKKNAERRALSDERIVKVRVTVEEIHE